MSSGRLSIATNENDDDELPLVFSPTRELPPGDPDRPSTSTPREDQVLVVELEGEKAPDDAGVAGGFRNLRSRAYSTASDLDALKAARLAAKGKNILGKTNLTKGSRKRPPKTRIPN